ncbi:transporter [Flavobacterium cyanobacteriorum]|uniref:Transporter n=1 Tax=Flavobacterium cyanobacteriorum TaxID=2022802 RepID=A0A255Z9D7_9FLAO|nr:transporter [Flavobacterium cyanobacteriorum]
MLKNFVPAITNRLRKALLITLCLVGFSAFAQPKKWTLQECIDYAIKNNISIKNTTLDEETAAVSKKDAWGSFLPTINGQASHSWNIGLNQNITTGLLENQTTQFTSAGLNVGLDIYNGLQKINQLRRANLALISAKYQVLKMQEDIALNVANAYLQILFNKENLKVQQQQLAYDTQQLERVQQLVDAGSVPKGDLLDVKATVATDNQRKIAAENTLLLSKLSLAQLMQLENFQDFDTVDSDYPIDQSGVLLEQPSAIFDKAKEQRTELKIARANVAVAEKDVKIARGAYQPTLQGFYSFNTRAAYADRIVGVIPDPDTPFSPIGVLPSTGEIVVQQNFRPVLGSASSLWKQFDDNKGHSFGVSLNIPVLNGFRVRNNVQRAKISLERSKITLQQQELTLETNVYTAYTDAQGALKAYEAAQTTLEAREGSFNYAKERYEVGLINIFDLNQAQTLFVNAQSEVLRTKYDFIFRVKILEFYFGIPFFQKQ